MSKPSDRDKDELDRQRGPHTAPQVGSASTAELPVSDPGERPLVEQRAILIQQVRELESTLQYMGSAHPRRKDMQAHLEQLRIILNHMDGELSKLH
jgi:hypothetical protein